MIKLEQTGVGTQENSDRPVYDSTGTGLLPVQVAVTGVATWRLLARVDKEAPWEEVVSARTTNLLQSVTWVPYLRLEVTAGAGKATCWIGEK